MKLGSRRLAALAFGVCAASIATADVQFGGGRAAGMGGAGLALPINARSSLGNPALNAFLGRGLDFKIPYVQLYTKGISINELRDNLKGSNSGGLDTDTLGDFAKKFGNEDKEFGLTSGLGISFSNFSFDLSADALVNSRPNTSLRTKINAGSTAFTAADALDGYGYGFYSFNFAYGAFIPMANAPEAAPTWAVGGRLRIVRSYYSHHLASGAQIVPGTGSTKAAEMGTDDVLTKSGVGFDLGIHSTFGMQRNLFGALTIRNLVRPRVGYDGTLPADLTGGVIGEAEIQPFKTMFDLGFGAQLNEKTALAIDVVDVGNRGKLQELRTGVDYDINKSFSVRAGYASRSGFSVGVGLFGFNIAISRQSPLSISAAFKF